MTLPDRSVWLDAQGAQSRLHFDRGIPRYINEQVRAMAGIAPETIAAVGLNEALPLIGTMEWLLGSGKLRWAGATMAPPRPAPLIYHVMSPMELGRPLDEMWPHWARSGQVKTVVTVYDLIPLLFPEHYLSDARVKTSYLARLDLIRHAHHVLALSQTTANDVVEQLHVLPDRVTVIDAGVSARFSGAGADTGRVLRQRFEHLRPGFVLYVGGIDYRKNLERLIEAHGLTTPEFRARHQLVITCTVLPEQRDWLRGHAARAGLREHDVIVTGYATDAELVALYRACDLFVFASFYEGSGLPMLEAMACGVPVAASNTSTSPELLGDDDATFNPYDARDIARVLQATLADPTLMERLRARSRERVALYTWDHVARQSLRGYERVLAPSNGRAVRQRRPRIALFTPWPPDRSGIAGYNHRLVEELARTIDVDIVVDGHAAHEAPAQAGIRVVRADEFEAQRPLRAYDRIVYCMGNSHFHGYIYEAAQRRPGIVVLHDVRLTGFYGWYSGRERPNAPAARLGERIAAMYGKRVGDFGERSPTQSEQWAQGLYMTHEVQEYADRIVVHSHYAADVLRLDRARASARDARVDVLPLAFPERPERPYRPADPAAPLIASFGIVHPIKRPDVLVEAFALLAADRPGARLVFAGGAEPYEIAEWQAVATDAGVGDAVSLLGHVTDDEWDRVLYQADVAVQLRMVSNGEASAAAADCLAAGVPLIVSDQGWFSELPADAATKVPVDVSGPGLAAAMEHILDFPDRTRQTVAAGRRHAVATSFAAVAERFLDVLGM
ncbi:MAG: glycosyltransferase [Solirubrobacteraceae bacterium]